MSNSYDSGLKYYNDKLTGDKQKTLEAAKIAYYNQITGRQDRSLDVAEMWFCDGGGDVPAPLPDTEAVVANGDSVAVHNVQGDNETDGTVVVQDGAVFAVNLVATAAVVQNGIALTMGGATYTFTVENGLITNIAVS